MLLKPDVKLERVTDIKLETLKKYNISALILDVDNTLSTHHGQHLTDGLAEWINYMQDGGIILTILSNSNKDRVEPFANKIGLDFESLGLKPLPYGFLRVIKKLGLKKRNTAIVGDQIFTDILGGNFVGIKTVLLTPILLEDGISFKIRRRLEKLIFKIYKIKNTEV